MNQGDIIFHLLPEKEWKKRQKQGQYRSPELEEEGFIHCSTGSQVEQTANRHFPGIRKLLLLVIDISSLDPELRYEEAGDETYPHVFGPINAGAVLDRIPLRPEEDGTFKISFKIEE